MADSFFIWQRFIRIEIISCGSFSLRVSPGVIHVRPLQGLTFYLFIPFM
jgi:hypothetical protein